MKKHSTISAATLCLATFALFHASVEKLHADTTPNFSWAVQAGSGNNDYLDALTLDSANNIYASGGFYSEAAFGGFTLDPGSWTVFVTKLNASDTFLWVQGITQAGINSNSISVDSSGNLFVAGYIFGNSVFGTSGTISLSNIGSSDIFVAKMNASTGNFAWAAQFGNTYQSDSANGTCVDASGNVYVTGVFSGVLPVVTTTGTTNLVSQGSNDAFIIKLDANGNALWAQLVDGDSSTYSYGNSITISGTNLYVAGGFSGNALFANSSGTSSLTSVGIYDNAFIAALNLTTGNFIWVRQGGGVASSVSASGTNLVVTGQFAGSATFGTTTLNTTNNNDAYFTKLDSSGNFKWAEQLGTTAAGTGIGIDAAGNAYVTGLLDGAVNVVTNTGTTSLVCHNSTNEIFVLKLSPGGNYLWAKQANGNDNDVPNALGLDSTGNVFLGGIFGGETSTTASFDSTTLTSNGGFNDFIAKLASGSLVPVITSANSAVVSVGSALSYNVTATNSPTSYSATGLPSWAGFNTTSGLLSGTPSVTGTYTLSISAINASGTGTTSLTIEALTPYGAWAAENGITTGPTSDPNHVGIPNLLEYALGLNPAAPSYSGLPVRSAASGYLTLTFNRQKIATDITYHVQATNDLSTWTEIWNSSGVSYGGGSNASQQVAVSDTVLMSSAPAHKRFLRLEITQP